MWFEKSRFLIKILLIKKKTVRKIFEILLFIVDQEVKYLSNVVSV